MYEQGGCQLKVKEEMGLIYVAKVKCKVLLNGWMKSGGGGGAESK